jgi:hypothetical protein
MLFCSHCCCAVCPGISPSLNYFWCCSVRRSGDLFCCLQSLQRAIAPLKCAFKLPRNLPSLALNQKLRTVFTMFTFSSPCLSWLRLSFWWLSLL